MSSPPQPQSSLSNPTRPDLALLDTTSTRSNSHETTPQSGLRIQTDMTHLHTKSTVTKESTSQMPTAGDPNRLTTTSISIPLARTPSVKNIIASSAGSNFGSAPNSALSSPMLNAMADVTPLPSPLMSNDSPGPWRKLGARNEVRDKPLHSTPDATLVTSNGESISAAIANHTKRRAYHGLVSAAQDSGLTSAHVNKEKINEGHVRNRSISEYVPETLPIPKIRNITVSGSHAHVIDITPISENFNTQDMTMRREPHLAVQRGLAPIPRPPTPPRSRTGGESSDSDSSLSHASVPPRAHKKARHEYFEASSRVGAKRRRWRAVKVLGQGTFSKVVLATSQLNVDDRIEEDDVFGVAKKDGIMSPIEPHSHQKSETQQLVAVKICEHGPKGGASEERVEMSLKRELEIMKSIHHPSLVQLKAWSIEETRAILVLGYCPGGDLFDLASQRKDLLVPNLLRRMFAEIVGAVRYLHERHIVHRDIKLENILVNLPAHDLAQEIDWTTHPYSLTTLTDLGLSRRVADDEKLTTRCGSDDYAAPEVIMGQPYDGRATDAWSLGVLLYALLESRLPFDPNPGMSEGHKQRSRTSHRIARVDWSWVHYAGEEGDHESDPEKFKAKGLEGAMRVTEGLLRRSRNRWTLGQVMQEEWIGKAIAVDGGIRFTPEDQEEVL